MAKVSEAAFRSRLTRRLRQAGAVVINVENLIGEGTPDLYVAAPEGPACWVELKATDGVRIVRASNLTPAQVTMAEALWQRHRAGVLAVQTRHRVYVLPGDAAGALRDGISLTDPPTDRLRSYPLGLAAGEAEAFLKAVRSLVNDE